MAISDTQKVDLLYKKLFGATKTDLATNKSPSNEAIASPLLIRGDTVWVQSSSIPATAAALANVVQAYQTTSRVQCTADATTTAISSVYPTWKTGVTDWIPPEFGSTYFVKVYADTAGTADPTGNTALSDAGISGVGEWYFDYVSGVLNFIGGTIPASLTASKVIFITGYRYIGTKGISASASSNVANTANALTNARDIGLAGDLTGNVSFDGSGNVTLTATIAANSVALGGDTTGYFIGNITAGTGITLSGAAGENANITVTNSGVTSVTGTADQITASASTGGITLSLPNDVTINNNLTVSGNLFIKGTATTLQTATLSINDSLVKFGNANPANSVDLGFFGEYVSGGNVNYSGLFRDHNDGKFRVFEGSTVNPTGNTISTTDAGYTIASLVANLTGGTVSGLTANIAVGDGGTGRGTFTTNGILFGNTTGALKVTAAGTSGQVLRAGTNGTPEFGGLDGGTY
jgi:hypothetical protein